VADVTLVEREKELAEKEAQVCRTQQVLCPKYYVISYYVLQYIMLLHMSKETDGDT